MESSLLVVLLASECFSIYLIFRLCRKHELLFFKILIGLITLIPLLGPIAYFFVMGERVSVDSNLKNTGPRGEYTHNWISMRPILRSMVKELSNPENKKECEENDKVAKKAGDVD